MLLPLEVRNDSLLFIKDGPYNPYRYKPHIVPNNYPTTEEIKHIASRFYTDAPTPLRNVRHINPVR